LGPHKAKQNGGAFKTQHKQMQRMTWQETAAADDTAATCSNYLNWSRCSNLTSSSHTNQHSPCQSIVCAKAKQNSETKQANDSKHTVENNNTTHNRKKRQTKKFNS